MGERIDSMLCTATLLAALAITQSPPTSALGPGVDSTKSSKLKEGDLVRINAFPFAYAGIFASPEQVRESAQSLAKLVGTKQIPSTEGLIQVGHNTPAKIERISVVNLFGGETRLAQVTLGSGALRGQRFWIGLNALRDAREPDPAKLALSAAPPDKPADEPADEPRRNSGRKRPSRRPAEDPEPVAGDLVLTDLAVNPSPVSSDWIVVQGRFRNGSGQELRNLRVKVSLEDRAGQLVRAESTFCEPDVIAAGGSGSFEVRAQADVRYARAKVEFMDRERAISWVDRSGKDAHP
jgi:hypothetical protein